MDNGKPLGLAVVAPTSALHRCSTTRQPQLTPSGSSSAQGLIATTGSAATTTTTSTMPNLDGDVITEQDQLDVDNLEPLLLSELASARSPPMRTSSPKAHATTRSAATRDSPPKDAEEPIDFYYKDSSIIFGRVPLSPEDLDPFEYDTTMWYCKYASRFWAVTTDPFITSLFHAFQNLGRAYITASRPGALVGLLSKVVKLMVDMRRAIMETLLVLEEARARGAWEPSPSGQAR